MLDLENCKKQKMNRYLLLIGWLLMSAAAVYGQAGAENPAAEGFNLAGSDARAIALADAVMAAQGGRAAWDETRYLSWNFFGRRQLLWDKWTGDVRIDFVGKPTVLLVNVNTGLGQAQVDGVVQTHPDSLAKYAAMARSIWINDSYWLFMPFKLKDSGLTLRYAGDTLRTAAGRPADWLELTFARVGDTPDNKYLVAVDKATQLVSEWRYFAHYNDAAPRIMSPWEDYKPYGRVLLSGNRGPRQITDIAVYRAAPESAFRALAIPDRSGWQ